MIQKERLNGPTFRGKMMLHGFQAYCGGSCGHSECILLAAQTQPSQQLIEKKLSSSK
jgi:hypothetical protein